MTTWVPGPGTPFLLAQATLNLAQVAGTYDALTASGDMMIEWGTISGSPNGVITAPPGSLYTSTAGGAATTLYVKESTQGNTGWVAK